MSREKFEECWRGQGGNLELAPDEWGNGKGAYKWEDTGNAWRLWQTARKDADDEIALLRRAARLCFDRGWMVSGSIEMAECDAICKQAGLDPWAWKHRFQRGA